jgi:hypothetical protein
MFDGQNCLELREVANFVDCSMPLCFKAISAVRAWDFVYDLSAVSSSFHFHQPFVLSYNSGHCVPLCVLYILE